MTGRRIYKHRLLRKARVATRTHRRDGTADRYCTLWERVSQGSLDRPIGRCLPETLEDEARYGQWVKCSPLWRDGDSYAIEFWWRELES